MKLQELYIEKYKNIEKQTFDFSQHNGLSLLIGTNGSGKSNVLEFLSSIFYHIISQKDGCESEFRLEYTLSENPEKKEILEYKNGGLSSSCPLPKRLIAIYSGEEDRMWRHYYSPVYRKYIADVKKGIFTGEYPQMLFLDKNLWAISLLSLLCKEDGGSKDFIRDTLCIDADETTVTFTLGDKIESLAESPSKILVSSIEADHSYTIDDFKKLSKVSENDLFLALYTLIASETPAIKGISFQFNPEQSLESLSEGHKKLLLIKAALEFAGQEDTLYLLDEPDAHVHIQNKIKLIDIIKEYTHNRHVILTTHSPTVVDLCKENTIYLSKGKVQSLDVLHAISQLSNEKINYISGGLILSSDKPLVLVEGTGDIAYISKALTLLKEHDPSKYNLDMFDMLYMGGADKNAAEFIRILKEKVQISDSRKVIAVFDRDDSGTKAMKALTGSGNREDFNTYKKDNYYFLMLPKSEGHSKPDFTIEDYFSKEIKEHLVKAQIDYAENCFNYFPQDLRRKIKSALASGIDSYTYDNMKDFHILIDKIKNIINGDEPVEPCK